MLARTCRGEDSLRGISPRELLTPLACDEGLMCRAHTITPHPLRQSISWEARYPIHPLHSDHMPEQTRPRSTSRWRVRLLVAHPKVERNLFTP